MPSYSTYKQAFAGRQLPFAYLDLDLLKANIRDVIRRAGAKRVRVASKSIRSRAVLEKILASNPIFRGVMCMSAPEAVFLSRHGIDDLLIGYPCWHPEQIGAVCRELRQGRTIVAMVDSPAHVRHLDEIAAAHDALLPVCIEIDLTTEFPGLRFGAWRSTVRAPEDALRIYEAITRARHVRLDGVMGYEAQIAGVADSAPGQEAKNALIRALKARSLPQIAERRAAVVGALRSAGARLRFVNGGGTGSLESTIREDAVTEVAVGSAFFAPTLFDGYRAFRHLPAAGFAIEIVRQPAPDIYTCLGGGYVASGSAGPEKLPQPYLPHGARLTPLEGAGEVQTPICYNGPERLALGDPIFMRHAKAGELCERFDALLLVSGGQVVGEALTYRGEGQCFL